MLLTKSMFPFAAARSPRSMLWMIAWAIALAGCQTNPLRAQDDEPAAKEEAKADEQPKADPGTPLGKFQAALAAFKEKQASLRKMQQEFPKAAPKRQKELEAEFGATMAELQKSLPAISELAQMVYDEDPKADSNALEILKAMIARALSGDQYESALEMATKLIDKGCDDSMVLGLAGQAAFGLDQFDLAEKRLLEARKSGALDRMGEMILSEMDETKAAWAEEEKIRKAETAKDDNPQVKIETSKGDVVIELYEDQAPGAVGNFISLVKKGYYDGLTFHRVLPNFMAQGGCPDGNGSGGPGYKIFCECEAPNHRNHFRGTLSMAHAGKNTGGSQFFLTFRRTSHLDGKHTVFGRVVEGLDVLEKLQRIDPQGPSDADPDKIVKATVLRDRGHEYKPKVAAKGN